MAATYKTDGIILQRSHHRESDTLVRVLTRDYGKLTLRAISARKITSKLAGHLEPFVYTDLHIARSKTIDIIAGSNTIEANANLRTDIARSAMASYIGEIVQKFTQDQHADIALFDHLQETLCWLNDHTANALVMYASVLRTLAILGYRLELYDCHVCHKSITQDGSKFHYALWNVECSRCSSHDETVELTAEAIKVLRFASTQPFDAVAQLHVNRSTWVDVNAFVRSLLRYHMDHPLRSEHVLAQVTQ